MLVSSCFSNIYKWLVKDRKSNALNKGRRLIIMQMQTESGKLETWVYWRKAERETQLNPETPEEWRHHAGTYMTYETPRQENNKLPPEHNQTKSTTKNTDMPSHGTWLGSHRFSQTGRLEIKERINTQILLGKRNRWLENKEQLNKQILSGKGTGRLENKERINKPKL